MNITKNVEGKKLTLTVEGRLDTTTAPELEEAVKESVEGIEELEMDFSNLEYISSAGLRVLLATQKIMSEKGSMVIKGANETVKEVFEVTGFCDILTIE